MRPQTLFALAFVLALPASAQQNGGITGTVRDGGRMPLVGVQVTIRNQATRSETVVYSGQDGAYHADGLPPQFYTVEASRAGLQTESRHDLALGPDAELRMDLVLGPIQTRWSLPAAGTLGDLFIAALVPALVTLLITEPGRKILQKLWAPFRWIGDKLYEVFASRFPMLVGLPGYRKRVLLSYLARIENPVGPEDLAVPLEQAYAPLAVMRGDSQERVEMFSFAAGHPRLIVLGGPGTGKSTLMKSLLLGILNQRCDPSLNRLIPVFVVLREMAKASLTVEQAIVAALGNFRFKSAERFVRSGIETGRLFIILDGLDEVGANRQDVAEQIRLFCQEDDLRSQRNRLVVTCREAAYTTRDLGDVIQTTARVEPFAPQHMRVFLQGWPSYKSKVALRL